MLCPKDGSTLLLSSREGVEIDFCPECRGVWLDRGELDKIIERTEQSYGPPRSTYDRDDTPPSTDRPGHKRKKRGFLENMFDFGGD